MMRRLGLAILLCMLLVNLSGQAFAQDPAVVDIFQNGVYGGLAGALVGAAALAFTDDPGDHLDYLGIGAGVGVIAGTAYGIYTATRPLALLQKSSTSWHFPSLQAIRIGHSFGTEVTAVEYRITLLRFIF